MVCDKLRRDEEGDTSSQRLGVCRRTTYSVRVVVRNGTQHRALTFPRASRREVALVQGRKVVSSTPKSIG